jgi:hypothetical protein
MSELDKKIFLSDIELCKSIFNKFLHYPREYKRLFTTEEIIFMRELVDTELENLKAGLMELCAENYNKLESVSKLPIGILEGEEDGLSIKPTNA